MGQHPGDDLAGGRHAAGDRGLDPGHYVLVWMTVAPGLAFLPILVGVVCHLWWHEANWAGVPAGHPGSPQVAIPKAAGATSTDRPSTQARDRQLRPEHPVAIRCCVRA
jgi:hypothetical protein